MAEFKNLTNQIRVTSGSSIKFYNKVDANNNTIIGVKADNGEVVLFNVTSGQEDDAIERFLYSEVTLPTSLDLAGLTLVIHEWIYDAPLKKNIDSIYTSIVTNTDGLKTCKRYSHDPSTNSVECFDEAESMLFVFNETLGKVLYMLGSEEYTGENEGGVLTYDVNILGGKKTDKLYILYKPDEDITEESYLRDIKNILEQNLIQSTLTTMILQDSYNSGLTEDDVIFN